MIATEVKETKESLPRHLSVEEHSRRGAQLRGWVLLRFNGALPERRMSRSKSCIAVSAIRICTRCATNGTRSCRPFIPVFQATKLSGAW